MNKEIIIHEQVTIWVERTCGVPEDMSEEEIKELTKNNKILDDDRVEIENNNFMMETEKIISPKENEGQATCRYISFNNKKKIFEIIADNSTEQQKTRHIFCGKDKKMLAKSSQ